MQFGNAKLEYERITSQVLQGILWPDDFIELCSELSSLEIPDTNDEINVVTDVLQQRLLDNLNLLKIPTLVKFFSGDDKETLELLTFLYDKTVQTQRTYHLAVQGKIDEISEQLENILSQQTDYTGMGKAIAMFGLDNDRIKQIDSTDYKLQKTTAKLRNIIDHYGTGSKFSMKPRFTSYDQDFKLYINSLYYHLDDFIHNPLVSMNIYTAIDAISKLVPKDDLNPFTMDQCNNLVKCLMNPEDYYSMCQREEILSKTVANLFIGVYPEFVSMFIENYMEDYDKMDLQEKTNFRNCFGLTENVTELVTLCSNYITLGFSSPH